MNWIFLQTLRGSFSAVSTPIFASKYSLESSRRDLHNALLCTVLQSQNFSQTSSAFFRDWIIEFPIFFHCLRRILHFCCDFFMKFPPDFATNSRKEWRVSLFQSHLRKQIKKLPKILKSDSVKIIHYYSSLFIRVLSADANALLARLGARLGATAAPRARAGAPLSKQSQPAGIHNRKLGGKTCGSRFLSFFLCLFLFSLFSLLLFLGNTKVGVWKRRRGKL